MLNTKQCFIITRRRQRRNVETYFLFYYIYSKNSSAINLSKMKGGGVKLLSKTLSALSRGFSCGLEEPCVGSNGRVSTDISDGVLLLSQ